MPIDTVTFEYGTKFVTDCYDCIEPEALALWTMYVDGYEVACLCDVHKYERERIHAERTSKVQGLRPTTD